MTQQAKLVIVGLSLAVVSLVLVLAAVLASDDDGSMNHMGSSGDPYMGMMQAMGQMNSDQMLDMMRPILGPDGYQRMLEHMAEHRRGGMIPHGSGVDGDAPDDGRNDAAHAG